MSTAVLQQEQQNGQYKTADEQPKQATQHLDQVVDETIQRQLTNTSHLFDRGAFDQCYRIAKAMANASLVPGHLRGNTFEETVANCFMVVNQAIRWSLDPFMVAPETYVVDGKLGFQGKLVLAVINTRAGLSQRLLPEFTGTGDDRTVTLSGVMKGETKPREITVSVAQGKSRSKFYKKFPQDSMWSYDPDQKLIYTAAAKWARRHAPEVILGVLTEDDSDESPSETPVAVTADSLRAKLTADDRRPVNPEASPGELASPDQLDAIQHELDRLGWVGVRSETAAKELASIGVDLATATPEQAAKAIAHLKSKVE